VTPPPTTTEPVKAAVGATRILRADARRNRERVLAAARQRFAEDGLDAQIDDIAKAAGVGVGTVYRHFPTKEDLIEALIAARFDRLAEWMREALEEDDPWRAFCDFMYRSDEMHRAAVDSGLHALTEELIARAQKSGGMRSDAVVEDVPAIICGLGRVTRASVGQKTISWERFLAILLDGLRARADCSQLPAP
jgi:AcrR family transcriptional regulator